MNVVCAERERQREKEECVTARETLSGRQQPDHVGSCIHYKYLAVFIKVFYEQ